MQENLNAPESIPFSSFIQGLKAGEVNDELTEKLQKLVGEVTEHNMKGKIKLELSIVPNKKGTVFIYDDITVSPPKPSRGGAVYFNDKRNNLIREDPRQKTVFQQIEEMESQEALKNMSQQTGQQ